MTNNFLFLKYECYLLVDVGDMDGELKKEPRTIVSGLVRHVPKEYLEGRAVIVVGNMKPSKLRGVMSEGMLLCAMEQDADGQVTKVGLLEPAEGSQPGDKVIFEGYTDQGKNLYYAEDGEESERWCNPSITNTNSYS